MTRTPAIDLADTTLVLANAAQQSASLQNQYETWFGTRGYGGWENMVSMRQPFFNKDARWNKGNDTWLTWALVPRSDPTTADILSSCETYLRPGLYLSPGETTPRDCATYGVAVVFTHERHRGRGYARHMLQLLHYFIAAPEDMPPFPESAWGAPPELPRGLTLRNARFSVLYSGVGDHFYAKCRKGLGEGSEPGWVRQYTASRVWDVSREPPAVLPPGARWLSRQDLPSLEAEASARIRRELPSTGDPSKTRLAILPDPGCFEVHAMRYLTIPEPRPESELAFGLVLPSEDGQPEFIMYNTRPTWDAPGRPEILRVMYATRNVPFSALVAAAQKAGARTVEFWTNETKWDDEAGGPKVEKDEPMSCLAVYGLGGDDGVEWEWDQT